MTVEFKDGDKLRYIGAKSHYYTEGGVYELQEKCGDTVWLTDDESSEDANHEWDFWDLEANFEHINEPQFKAGDKVRYVGDKENFWARDLTKGKVYKVIPSTYATEKTVYIKDDNNDYVAIGKHKAMYFERIEASPTKKQRITALEQEVATIKQQMSDLQTRFGALLQHEQPTVSSVSYGFEKPGEVTGEIGAKRTHISQLTPNEQRKLIIEKAKRFVTDALSRNHVGNRVFKGFQFTQNHTCEFVVNAEKRTVVALVKEVGSKGLYARGIAKCMPSDVFNEHIGKAITLGRAIGLDVSEFENAVQPTEVVVGTEVLLIHIGRTDIVEEGRIDLANADISSGDVKITNDTDAQY